MKAMSVSRRIQKLLIIVALYAGILLFFAATDPLHLPLPLLIVPFLLTYLAIYLPLRWWWRYKHPEGGKDRRHMLMAAVIAAYPTLILILGSLNQLTLRDALLLAVLSAGGTFYVSRLT